MINIRTLLLCSIIFLGFHLNPRAQNPEEATNNIRVITYNIATANEVEREKEIEEISLLIQQTKPDLVAFQGIENRLLRSGDIELIKYIATQAGLHMVESQTRGNKEPKTKLGVLSKYPITQNVTMNLPADRDGSPRYMLGVEVDHPVIGTITFAAVEIETDPNVKYPVGQAAVVNRAFQEKRKANAIIAGSIFAKPKSKVVKSLKENWVDASTDFTHLTYPANNPKIKVDYIFLRKDNQWKVRASRVINAISINDHLPLVLDLEWQGK